MDEALAGQKADTRRETNSAWFRFQPKPIAQATGGLLGHRLGALTRQTNGVDAIPLREHTDCKLVIGLAVDDGFDCADVAGSGLLTLSRDRANARIVAPGSGTMDWYDRPIFISRPWSSVT